jgi:hypothetical protein
VNCTASQVDTFIAVEKPMVSISALQALASWYEQRKRTMQEGTNICSNAEGSTNIQELGKSQTLGKKRRKSAGSYESNLDQTDRRCAGAGATSLQSHVSPEIRRGPHRIKRGKK